jgi:uncharacterized membrane protein YqjE
VDPEPSPAGLLGQVKAMFATCLSALQNRSELFLLECEEGKSHLVALLVWVLVAGSHLVELLVWVMAAGLLGLMFLALGTVWVILLFPEEKRIYAVGGFCLLYLAGAVLALLNLRLLLRNAPPPFSGTLNEMKKDRACLDSSK